MKVFRWQFLFTFFLHSIYEYFLSFVLLILQSGLKSDFFLLGSSLFNVAYFDGDNNDDELIAFITFIMDSRRTIVFNELTFGVYV